MANQRERSKICAALSYILIGIIWYFADDNMRKNEFAKFHAKQGLVLLIASIALNVIVSVLGVASIFLGPIALLWSFISVLIWLGVLALMVLGIVNALNEKKSELPVIGSLAKHFTF